MSTEKNKEVTFNWTPAFEVALAKLMLQYRCAGRPEGSVESELAFEKRHARDFATSLRTLMTAHAPELAGDSDIETRMASMRIAHDGAMSREISKHGGIR